MVSFYVQVCRFQGRNWFMLVFIILLPIKIAESLMNRNICKLSHDSALSFFIIFRMLLSFLQCTALA